MTAETGEVRRAELEREQDYLTRLYSRLDALRDQTRARLTEVRRRGATGTHQQRSERDAFNGMYEARLAQLNAVESGLAFGRLDMSGGDRHYIGRIGLTDEGHDTLLVDWRAPVAEPFYRATPANPHRVIRRRHLRTRGRSLLDVEDDVFDLDAMTDDDRATLGGEGALLAALSERRTGRMRDIVATIQAEQDRIIRADLDGVLVVQGGPGTGKTAVALHRAAYLLYSHRDKLERSGVLVLGPNAVFLRYIEQVLPSLGESGVVLATLDTLVPGVTVTAEDSLDVALVKADAGMAERVASTVAEILLSDLVVKHLGKEMKDASDAKVLAPAGMYAALQFFTELGGALAPLDAGKREELARGKVTGMRCDNIEEAGFDLCIAEGLESGDILIPDFHKVKISAVSSC